MQRWLVTGASGFLGANAGLWLGGRAHRIGLSRAPSAFSTFDEYQSLDLLDGVAVARAVESSRPDVILHCAALASHERCESDPRLAERMNATATRTLAEEAAACGATLVYISTDAVFDGTRGNYAETDAPAPFSVYGATKLMGEAAVVDSGADALIVRTNFFGWSPTGTRSILEFFVDALRAGRSVPGYTDFIVTSIYVRDLVEIVHKLALSEHRGLVHVASADALSKFSFANAVAERFALPSGLITPVSSPSTDGSPSRARDISLRTDLLAVWLGQQPPLQSEGILAAYDDEASVPSALRATKESP